MSRAKRGSFQQAKEKEVCILWSHSSALCTNLLRTALLDSGVALAPRKLPLLYCAPLYFGFMTPHQMLAATSLFSFSHLKCLNYSGPQECPKIWGQVVIQGLLKDKVLPLYLAKSKGAIAHLALRLRRLLPWFLQVSLAFCSIVIEVGHRLTPLCTHTSPSSIFSFRSKCNATKVPFFQYATQSDIFQLL